MRGRFKIGVLFLGILLSCRDERTPPEIEDTPTSGELTVYTDTCISEIVRVFARTFESQYPRARVYVKTACRNDLIRFLQEKKIRAVVFPDSLTAEEKQSFSPQFHYLRFSRLTFSGIVFFCRKSDSARFQTLSQDTLSDLLQSAGTDFFLPPSCSYVPHFLFEKLSGKKSFHYRVYFVAPDSVTHYLIRNNNSCIGVLEYGLLSDRDDPRVKQFLKDFYIIPLKGKDGDSAFFPDPANFDLNRYPLRTLWHYYRDAPEFSLAKGFESFMAGEQGQRLFLKYGLLPHRKPGRLIKIRFEKFQ